MNTSQEKQESVTKYYDKFSKVYDWISSDAYYSKPREYAFEALDLKPSQIVLNMPCGTGQSFSYYQKKMNNKGMIYGIDLSEGMLKQAKNKINANQWTNVKVLKGDATKINIDWINKNIEKDLKFDSILCDLGLSGFPEWKTVIDNLLSLLKPEGKLVIMDWYIKEPGLRGSFIKWIGKGEVSRPIYQYLESKCDNFQLNNSFKKGDMFVAVGTNIHTGK